MSGGARLARNVRRILERLRRDEKARVVQLVKLTPGSGYDPGEPAETRHEVTIVAYDYSQHERDGTLVQENDTRMIMDGNTRPESQDRIEDGDKVLTVVRVQPIETGPILFASIIQVRA